MRVIIILTLIIILILCCINLANNKEFFYNDLIQKTVINFDESFAMTAFEEGDDEIKLYKFSMTPIMGAPNKAKLIGPELGFYHEEIKRNKMNDAISTSNSVSYVDNEKMVPYLFVMIKRLAKQNTAIQKQLNQLAASIKL